MTVEKITKTSKHHPDIYPDGEIIFFGDWFRVKDRNEALEIAELIQSFVRELIEALDKMVLPPPPMLPSEHD